MSRSVGLAHVVRESDGTATGTWGPFVLRSAFQPIFAFNGGKLSVAAFEGLARPFRNGEGVGAGAFFAALPVADRFNVDSLLRTIHLLNAGRFLPREAMIFINFDPSVIGDRATADAVLRDLRLIQHESGVEPARLVCEMTEQRLSSAESFLYFIDSLRGLGFRVAVDDYGAEDSDIERIRAVAPDIVKFDARWITRLMESGPGFALLAALVESFSAQNIQTVFEGIEEGWQLDLAERAGASMVQGYVLRRPELVPTSFAVAPVLAAVPPPPAFDDVPASEPDPFPEPQIRPAPAKPVRAFGRRVVTP